MFTIMFKRRSPLQGSKKGWQYALEANELMMFKSEEAAQKKADEFTLLLGRYGYEYRVVSYLC